MATCGRRPRTENTGSHGDDGASRVRASRSGALLAWPLCLIVATLSLDGTALGQGAAPGGANVTPDERSYLVSKDINGERWAIGLNLARVDPPVLASVTGNVFRPDGGPPAFVFCQVRPDSTGSLLRPESSFRLRCSVSDACTTTARECAQSSWRLAFDAEEFPATFFLPRTGGDTALAETPRSGTGVGGRDLGRAAQDLPRGTTLTLDGNSFLVSKDIAGARWAISVNLVQTPQPGGGSRTSLANLTGNVFSPAGGPPEFVYCRPGESSTGRLEDPASTFRLDCFTSAACELAPSQCAAGTWVPYPPVEIPASFLLPPGGLESTSGSDPEILVLGRTWGPPSLLVREFSEVAGPVAGGATGCRVGAACEVARVGACAPVAGVITEVAGFGCGCLVEVPGTCVECGRSASGECGGACEFPVGAGSTARGSCTPYVSDSATCACFATSARSDGRPLGCAGALAVACPGGSCCADDPLDGCQTSDGDFLCPGVCVLDGCPGGAGGCGICVGRCGNGLVEAGESCDGDDLQGRRCEDLGYLGGELRCGSSCQLVETGCLSCRELGETCTGSGECCLGACIAGRCSGDPPPTRTPPPPPSRTPPRTPTPTPQPVCQPLTGGPCSNATYSGCCSPDLACLLGPGNPPVAICGRTAGCGNGRLDAGEQCDDGNATSGDGCDVNCTATSCGNGILTSGESCDDGNAVADDGCDPNCKPSGCGNGFLNAGEACDDGNATSGDGCDANCTATACRNGIVTSGEECDDGNSVDTDGCTNACDLPECGDGITSPGAGEQCDDGNSTNTDGCTNACNLPVCGDGIVSSGAGEQCESGPQCGGGLSCCLAFNCGPRCVCYLPNPD